MCTAWSSGVFCQGNWVDSHLSGKGFSFPPGGTALLEKMSLYPTTAPFTIKKKKVYKIQMHWIPNVEVNNLLFCNTLEYTQGFFFLPCFIRVYLVWTVTPYIKKQIEANPGSSHLSCLARLSKVVILISPSPCGLPYSKRDWFWKG